MVILQKVEKYGVGIIIFQKVNRFEGTLRVAGAEIQASITVGPSVPSVRIDAT